MVIGKVNNRDNKKIRFKVCWVVIWMADGRKNIIIE